MVFLVCLVVAMFLLPQVLLVVGSLLGGLLGSDDGRWD